MQQHIVIVGGGFAGINLIKALKNNRRFKVTLVDKNNYHFFPPLIYQVATAFIEASNISYPFRKFISKFSNVRFHMGSLLEIRPKEHLIVTDTGELHYDQLVLAMGSEPNFFGLQNVQKFGFVMKNIDEALYLRNQLLINLEQASRTQGEFDSAKVTNVVIAGGGPTGVELVGMLAEMKKYIGPREYPEIKLGLLNLFLVDAAPSLLANMSPLAQKTSFSTLESLGVQIILNTTVVDYIDHHVILSNGATIETNMLIWTSGVIAREVPGLPMKSISSSRRILVDPYNTIIGSNNIYALGDLCLQLSDERFIKGHPQVAQVAIQQGLHLGKNFKRVLDEKNPMPFLYRDKGSMAIISKLKAVVDLPKFSFKGFAAWLTWLFIHVIPLVSIRSKIRLAFKWFWLFFTNNSSIRLILNSGKAIKKAKDNLNLNDKNMD